MLPGGSQGLVAGAGRVHLAGNGNDVQRDTVAVIVDDRRVSRQHARIERRSDGFYLVDTSTNGSFVSIQGRQEALVRKHDVLLEGRGKICLGSTINDGRSECLEFEHL